MKQTAVEWFCEQILLKNPIITQFLPNWNFDQSIIDQAKEMEKEQIIKAYQQGVTDEHGDTITFTTEGEEYYNSTYKS
jgi:hypothetical protein